MLLALIINCHLNLTNYNEDFLDNYINQINEDQEDLGEIEYQSEFTSETESGNETVYSSRITKFKRRKHRRM
jgi:hypothetical protein